MPTFHRFCAALTLALLLPSAVAAPTCTARIVAPSSNLAPACDDYRLESDVAYGPDPAHRMDIYLPGAAQRAFDTPYPVIVWIHGGQWQTGDKTDTRSVLTLVCRGYAVASVNYRLSGEAKFPAQIHDVKAAIRHLRGEAASYGIDGTRIAAFGASAGGHLAALAGTSDGVPGLDDQTIGHPGVSSKVQAVIDWYGPTDFSKLDSALLRQGCPANAANHGASDSPESKLLGCTVSKRNCATAVDLADPITHVDASDAPALIMHGNDDCQIPLQQGSLLYKALRNARVPAAMATVTDAGHGTQHWESASLADLVEQFLANRLVAGNTACR